MDRMALAAVAVALCGGIAVALAQCSSVGGGGGAPFLDAGEASDSPVPGDVTIKVGEASPADVTGEKAEAGDGSAAFCSPMVAQEVTQTIAGWQGWRRLPGLDACCAIATPLDLAASMPAYSWVPCTNGIADCLEFNATWAQLDASVFNSTFFGAYAKVSRDANGDPKWLMFTRAAGPDAFAPAEYDLYDVASGAPLGAWRDDEFVDTTAVHRCYAGVLLGEMTVTIDAELTTVGPNSVVEQVGTYVAHGDPQTMLMSPSFTEYTRLLTAFQDRLASDTAFAFDAPDYLVRARFGAGLLDVQPMTTPMVWLSLADVEGQDVFGETSYTPWEQMYVFRSDSSLALLRSNSMAHVGTPTSDGTRLYWTETYGSTSGTQTQTELWSAPYTTDPSKLAATAAKIAAVPNAYIPHSSVAFGGLIAVVTSNGAVVGRVSDGKTQQVTSGTGRQIIEVIAVTPSELWAMEDEGTPYSPWHLTRIPLGDW
jgi:hypothetical protein